MRTIVAAVAGLSLVTSSIAAAQSSRATPFTVNQVRSYPFPNELTAAATGSRLAWAFNEQGRRNIFVAEGPAFSARQLTHYDRDDGQELSSVAVSANGKWVVYVRGGDHGSNWDDGLPVNVGSNPTAPKVQIFSVAFDGGDPKPIADGDEPVVSPRSDVVAFIKGGQIWTVPIDGSAPAKTLFTARGENADPRWSPDGSRLAFVANRGDHAFIGVYANDSTAITWLAPAFARDRSPLTHVAKIKAPLLVLQGENDPRVPQSEAKLMTDALKAAGKTFDQHVYPGEGHGFRTRENMIDSVRRATEWFDRYLQARA